MPAVTRNRQRRVAVKPAEVQRDDFLFSIEPYLDQTNVIPDICEFVMSDKYLGRSLYPIQSLMLKIAFLQDALFTAWDYEVIEWWSKSFALTGNYGCQPDILERIRINKALGRKWFREWICVLGRRGGKGYIGGLAASYILWHYLVKGDPQGFYGITYDKRLSMFVFGAKLQGAVSNQWGDVANVIKGGPCFQPYLPERPLAESLVVFAPNDFLRIADREALGQYPRLEDMATFEIVPKESTTTAARGPTAFALLFDEMSHITRANAKSDAEEIYTAATPALDQFKQDAWIYEGSSPWQMLGQFYANWVSSLAISDGSDGLVPGSIARPDQLMFQLPSWDAYIDWKIATTIPIRPVGLARPHALFYPPQKLAFQEPFDPILRAIEAANPEKFAVERKSHWASVLDAYLNPERVEQMFDPWPADNPMNVMRNEGSALMTYIAHGDPGAVNDNFSFAVAHKVYVAGSPLPHVIIDYVNHWEHEDFPDNNYEVEYEAVLNEIKGLARRFLPEQLTFDQGGPSVWMIQNLRKWVSSVRLIKPVTVFVRTATRKSNWEQAETFKTALNMGIIHCPKYDQARSELLFLQKTAVDKVEAPTTGPVQHDDVAICLFNLVHALIGEHIASMVGDSMPSAQAAAMGGLPMPMLSPRSSEETPEVIARLAAIGKRPPRPYTPERGGRFYQPRGRRR